jgi:cytochrome c oxidase assembly protein subunit 17
MRGMHGLGAAAQFLVTRPFADKTKIKTPRRACCRHSSDKQTQHNTTQQLFFSSMSATAATATPTTPAPAAAAAPANTNAAGKRICCVCKDTKKVRDECIFQFGEDKCQEPIELHKVCLRSEGFDIQ